MGDSKICCCNVFSLAKWLIITEIVLILLGVIYPLTMGINKALIVFLSLAYLGVELYGICKKNEALIIFGIVIRVLETLTIFFTMIAFFVVPICGNKWVPLNNCEAEREKYKLSLEEYENNVRYFNRVLLIGNHCNIIIHISSFFIHSELVWASLLLLHWPVTSLELWFRSKLTKLCKKNPKMFLAKMYFRTLLFLKRRVSILF